MPRDAFTFVEVLISLAISALLVGTLCSALIHVTRIERRTAVMREAPLQLQTLASRVYLGQEVQEDSGAWLVQLEEKTLEHEQGETAWMVWQLAPSEDPSFGYILGLRDGMGPW